MSDLHDGEENQERQAQDSPALLAEERGEPGDPDREEDRVHVDDLLLDEGERTEDDVLPFAPNVLQVLERRKMMEELPDHVRGEQRARDRGPDPDPRFREFPPMAGQQKRGGNRESEEERGVLVFEPEPAENAEPHPEAGVAGPQDPGNDENRAHPEERLEGVHRQQAVLRSIAGHTQHGQSGKELGVSTPSELAGDENRDRDERRARQSREDSKGRERAAEEQGDLRVQGNQGRGIHVSPVEVARHVEEIELVAKIPVTANAREEVKQELRGAEGDQRPRPDAGRRCGGIVLQSEPFRPPVRRLHQPRITRNASSTRNIAVRTRTTGSMRHHSPPKRAERRNHPTAPEIQS